MSTAAWLVMPTFNEAENIEAVVSAALAELEVCAPGAHRVLIVDDSSPDGTGQLADGLAERIHRLSQRLIRADALPKTINAVEASLREDFDARNSVMVLFMEGARHLGEHGRFLRAVDAADPDMKSFESLLQSGKPRCGQIRDAQRDYLFGKDSVEIGSVALTPLGPKGALGLLAIGASDVDRFHPGMSTEFLSRIGELVTYALTR